MSNDSERAANYMRDAVQRRSDETARLYAQNPALNPASTGGGAESYAGGGGQIGVFGIIAIVGAGIGLILGGPLAGISFAVVFGVGAWIIARVFNLFALLAKVGAFGIGLVNKRMSGYPRWIVWGALIGTVAGILLCLWVGEPNLFKGIVRLAPAGIAIAALARFITHSFAKPRRKS